MIVVLRMQKFEVEQKGTIPVLLDFAPMIGFLPVYETLEDATHDFPDGPFREVKDAEVKEP